MPAWREEGSVLSTLQWIVLVLAIDVGHVWSSLYRSWLDPEDRNRFSNHLLWIPLLCWLAGVLVFSLGGPAAFWRVLAGLAVYHFIRQQQGFLKWYRANDTETEKKYHLIDMATLTLGSLYPMLFWITHPGREFTWFVAGDLPEWTGAFAQGAHGLGRVIWLGLLASWLCKETWLWIRHRLIHWPRLLLIGGTNLSWNVGIVLLNGDIAFTATNCLAHGIPYFALVWIIQARRARKNPNQPLWQQGPRRRSFLAPASAALLFLVPMGLAYLEEGLWDALIWSERVEFFGPFHVFFDGLGTLGTGASPWLIPLLALPQATHYVLDGFIWKRPAQVSDSPLVPTNRIQ
jgi:hypothetical protein